ncbi:MAG: hypothetical protein ACI4OL_06830 [Gemmiger sp.]
MENSGFDLDGFVNNAVRVGANVGSNVLESLSDALEQMNLDLTSAPADENEKNMRRVRRMLDQGLANRQGGWITLGVFGWIFFGCFAVTELVMAILWGLYGDYSRVYMSLFIGFLPTLPLTFWAGFAGCKKGNRYGRLRKYLRCMRRWKANITALARDSATEVGQVRSELQWGISTGVLPNTCLDETGQEFYLDSTLYRPEQPVQKTAAPQKNEELAQQGRNFLQYLHGCRGRFSSQAEELQQMEQICGAIFSFVEKHPEQSGRVRRFAEYYLPTTRKLLDTACGLGDLRTDGAEAIRRDITGILHTLNQAYVNLYDSLLQEVSMDISTEIGTLEAMLNQDGLTHDFKSDFGASANRNAQQ